MGIVIWGVVIGGTLFMIWYGFNLLVRRPGVDEGADGTGAVVQCHLCRRPFPVRQMISRDKMAGFVNYFCGDCIESLYNDYVGKHRDAVGK